MPLFFDEYPHELMTIILVIGVLLLLMFNLKIGLIVLGVLILLSMIFFWLSSGDYNG